MTLQHIRVVFDRAGVAYQEIADGYVVRYVDASGDELFRVPPVGDGCRVIDAEPKVERLVSEKSAVRDAVAIAEKVAAVEAAEAEEAAKRYDVERDGDRRDPNVRGRRATDVNADEVVEVRLR
jgi:hypothetical protein